MGDVPFALSRAKKCPVAALRVGKVNKEPVTANTKQHGEEAFDDEDPPPATEASQASHLHNLPGLADAQINPLPLTPKRTHSEGEDASKGRRHTANQVKDGIPLANLVCSRVSKSFSTMFANSRDHQQKLTSRIPGAQQVDAAGEEASLKHTQQNSQPSHLVPFLDETHPNHAATPQDRDGGQMNPGSEFPHDDGRGWLEENVGDEKDQRDDILLFSCQPHTHP